MIRKLSLLAAAWLGLGGMQAPPQAAATVELCGGSIAANS